MTAKSAREKRLAAALKENLKRRKNQARAKAGEPAHALGTAPQAGLENAPETGNGSPIRPKGAAKGG